MTVVLENFQLTHPIPHRSSAVIVDLQLVGVSSLFPFDGEALRAIAGCHVAVQFTAARQFRFALVGMPAQAIADVEVHIVGVGFPGQDESEARFGGHSGVVLFQMLVDLVFVLGTSF